MKLFITYWLPWTVCNAVILRIAQSWGLPDDFSPAFCWVVSSCLGAVLVVVVLALREGKHK